MPLPREQARIGEKGSFPGPSLCLSPLPQLLVRVPAGRMADNGGDQRLPAQPAKDAWWFQAALDRKGRTEAKVLCKYHW